MGVFGGKFLGFSYAGHRSEELGIVRTIQDRFEIPLTPPIKDTTTEVPNYSGVYFWGSDYDRRNINIPFAFDDITESQLSTIKKLLNSRKVHELIFDEEPEKIYPAVVTNQSKIDFVCFDIFGERVYKGTGNFQFVSYTPYVRSTVKFVDELEKFYGSAVVLESENTDTASTAQIIGVSDLSTEQDYYHLDTAADTEPQMKSDCLYLLDSEPSTLSNNEEYGNFNGTSYRLYNNSLVSMPFQAYVSLDNMSTSGRTVSIKSITPNKIPLRLSIPAARRRYKTMDCDKYVMINSKDYTILGCNENYKPTGTLYNDCIVEGTFFNLDPKENIIEIEIDGVHKPLSKIDYRYRYH